MVHPFTAGLSGGNLSAPTDRRLVGYSRQCGRVQHRRPLRQSTPQAANEARTVSSRNGASLRYRSRPYLRLGTWQEKRLPAHAGSVVQGIRGERFRVDARRITVDYNRSTKPWNAMEHLPNLQLYS